MSSDPRTCYKFVNDLIVAEPNPPFLKIKNQSNLRGHALQLEWATPIKECRHHFFIARLGRIWNALPENVVLAPSIHNFTVALTKIAFENLIALDFY